MSEGFLVETGYDLASEEGKHMWLVLPTRAKHDEAWKLVGRIRANIRKIRVESDKHPIFFPTDLDYRRIGRSPEAL